MTKNPYLWSESSKFVNMPLVSVTLENGSSPLELEDNQTSVKISISAAGSSIL